MEHTIYKIQTEQAVQIESILAKYRGTEAWETTRKAFHEIIRTYIHGGVKNMTDKELDEHFERALVTTESDVKTFLDKSSAVLDAAKNANSPYYMVNVAHERHDDYFAVNQTCPVTGTGSKKLEAKFEAQNLYQRYPINATTVMPPRVANSHFPNWATIVTAMTDKTTFENTFALNADEVEEVFKVTSALDWNTAQGALFITPDLFGGAVFSPALYSVYFMGAPNSLMNIYFFISADGEGNPEQAFVGIVNTKSAPQKNIYNSTNRFAFTYISSPLNPVRYWLDVNDDNLSDFNLGVQVFYPSHPDPYIDVNASFSAQVSPGEIAFFTDIPGLSTIMLIQKGTLMIDLVKAYFPDSTSVQLWYDIGVLTGETGIVNELKALGLDLMSDIFGADVWTEKPTVIES
jgi:hypothetical protein